MHLRGSRAPNMIFLIGIKFVFEHSMPGGSTDTVADSARLGLTHQKASKITEA